MTFRRNLAAIIHIAVVMACASANGLSLTDLAKKIRPATLLLLVCGQDGKIIASGTGFLVSSDGLLVTNKHVINGGSHISAKGENGNTYKVIGIAAGAEHDDVVILKIEGANLPFLAFGDSDAVEVGQQVAIVGNPLGLGTLSEGIIAAKREFEGKQWLQVTAAISPGSSGSPIVNPDGEVIGVATFLLRGGQALNFAVPSKIAKMLLPSDAQSLKVSPLNEVARLVSGVTEGMSKREVESVLGPPTSITIEDFVIMKKTTYVYRQGKDTVTVVFKDDKVQSKDSTLGD